MRELADQAPRGEHHGVVLTRRLVVPAGDRNLPELSLKGRSERLALRRLTRCFGGSASRTSSGVQNVGAGLEQ
jgi:hypothetical protein